jgi:hypothetical protein
MVYNTQNYWVFGLFPSSGIVGTRKHDVSETRFISVLRCGSQMSWCLPPIHMRTKTRPVPETSFFFST